MGGASFIIAVTVALVFIDPVKSFFVNTSVAQNARETISDTLAGFVSSDSENYDPNLTDVT